MALELRWTNRALGRLDSIAAYIAKDSPKRAETFTQELRKKVDILKSQQIGTAWKVFGTKQYVLHPNYIAIYKVKNGEVQILTILHSAQERQ
ncbi:MAG: type II toxin-antitoxin system RelE/ParE family toxin [Polaromonas sp.]